MPRRGDQRLGKESYKEKMQRMVEAERERDAAKKHKTFKQRLERVRDSPIIPFLVFMGLWNVLLLRKAAPARGFAAGEYPPGFSEMPPEIQEIVKPVPHWLPIAKKPEPPSQ